MTDEQLQERLTYWQKRLRLADWHITAAFVRHTALDLPDQTGQTPMLLDHKAAHIMLLDPIDRHQDDWRWKRGGYDVELDLVHELLHLHPALDQDRIQKRASRRRVEVTINAIAAALIEEHRREGV